MTGDVSALINRVRDLVREHQHWFEAVSAWYKAAKWTKVVFRDYLAVRSRPAGRALLAVNDRPLDDSHRDRQSPAAAPTWWVPGSMLRAGDNALRLSIEQRTSSVALDGFNVEHLPDLTSETKVELRPQPKPTAQMAVAVALGAGFRPDADRWTVQAEQQGMRLSLHFERDVPARFLLGITVKLPTIGYSMILDDIWDFVSDAVKKKIKQLVREYYRRLEAGDPSAESIQAQLRDLRNYMELHETHLAHALSVSDETTLEEIIERTRKPDWTAQQPITVQPVNPPPPPLTVRPVPPRPQPAGMHWFVRLFLVMTLLGVTGVVFIGVALYLGMVNPARVLGIPEFGGDARQNELNELLRVKGGQTGDVQVSLLWFNKNDLDLEVVAPSGEKINFGHRASACGGKLDVDMNIAYGTASNKAIENIFWPQGGAPKGRYQVFVTHFTNHNKPDTVDPTPFSVRVVNRGDTQWKHGDVVKNDPKRQRVLIHEFEVR